VFLPELKNVPGLEHAETHRHPDVGDQHFYRFTREADITTVRALLACIRDMRALMFFDAEHPTISDFAAYIFMLRVPGGFLVQSANHGWSSDWVPVTRAQAQRYVRLCIPQDTGSKDEQISFYELREPFKDRQIDRSRKSPFGQYLNERLKIRTGRPRRMKRRNP
jgi:hypothetical protein